MFWPTVDGVILDFEDKISLNFFIRTSAIRLELEQVLISCSNRKVRISNLELVPFPFAVTLSNHLLSKLHLGRITTLPWTAPNTANVLVGGAEGSSLYLECVGGKKDMGWKPPDVIGELSQVAHFFKLHIFAIDLLIVFWS